MSETMLTKPVLSMPSVPMVLLGLCEKPQSLSGLKVPTDRLQNEDSPAHAVSTAHSPLPAQSASPSLGQSTVGAHIVSPVLSGLKISEFELIFSLLKLLTTGVWSQTPRVWLFGVLNIKMAHRGGDPLYHDQRSENSSLFPPVHFKTGGLT